MLFILHIFTNKCLKNNGVFLTVCNPNSLLTKVNINYQSIIGEIKMEKITFCIPSKNNRRYLEACIPSIRKNTYRKDHDIIVFVDADNDGNFTCKVCNLKTQNEDEMKHHQFEHLDVKWRYKCELCDATFAKSYAYQAHFDSIHMGKLHECDLCDFSTRGRTTLAKHKKQVESVAQ